MSIVDDASRGCLRDGGRGGHGSRPRLLREARQPHHGHRAEEVGERHNKVQCEYFLSVVVCHAIIERRSHPTNVTCTESIRRCMMHGMHMH